MKIFGIILAVAAIFVIWSYIENHIFTVHYYKVKDKKIPDSFHGVKLMYLVDFHNTSYERFNRRLKKSIEKQSPDYVLVGGDFLSRPDRDCASAVDLLVFLSERYHVYFENGNHETKMKNHPKMYRNIYQDFMSLTKGLNCHFLSNESCRINRDKDSIVINSLELNERYFVHHCSENLNKSDIIRLMGKCNSDDYNILLAHSPNYFDAYSDWGADLVLSGHNHGGMARIPFVMGVLSTEAKLFPKYSKGMYTNKDSKMIVSAGLGSHTIKVRFFNPPEIVMVTLIGE